MSVVAVIDMDMEVLAILQAVLEDAGYTVATAHAVDFVRSPPTLHTFFQTHHPHAVVYHLTAPYLQQWTFFCDHVLAPGYVPEPCMVLTTTDERRVETLVGTTPHTMDVVGRPFDLDLLIGCVDRAVDAYQQHVATTTTQYGSASTPAFLLERALG